VIFCEVKRKQRFREFKNKERIDSFTWNTYGDNDPVVNETDIEGQNK